MSLKKSKGLGQTLNSSRISMTIMTQNRSGAVEGMGELSLLEDQERPTFAHPNGFVEKWWIPPSGYFHGIWFCQEQKTLNPPNWKVHSPLIAIGIRVMSWKKSTTPALWQMSGTCRGAGKQISGTCCFDLKVAQGDRMAGMRLGYNLALKKGITHSWHDIE